MIIRTIQINIYDISMIILNNQILIHRELFDSRGWGEGGQIPCHPENPPRRLLSGPFLTTLGRGGGVQPPAARKAAGSSTPLPGSGLADTKTSNQIFMGTKQNPSKYRHLRRKISLFFPSPSHLFLTFFLKQVSIWKHQFFPPTMNSRTNRRYGWWRKFDRTQNRGKVMGHGPTEKTVSTVILTFWCPNENPWNRKIHEEDVCRPSKFPFPLPEVKFSLGRFMGGGSRSCKKLMTGLDPPHGAGWGGTGRVQFQKGPTYYLATQKVDSKRRLRLS